MSTKYNLRLLPSGRIQIIQKHVQHMDKPVMEPIPEDPEILQQVLNTPDLLHQPDKLEHILLPAHHQEIPGKNSPP